MSAAVRIGGFVVLLGAIFAIASATGAAVNPDLSDESQEEHMETSDRHAVHGESNADATRVPGLGVSESGYSLIPETTRFDRRNRAPFRFRIVDAGGETLREFDIEHERRMHLIIVRRDFVGFQHLHPRQLDDGSWEVDLELAEGGVYRAFADFATNGDSLTLAADVFVPGSFEPTRLPAPAVTSDAGDGYEVSLESGSASAGGAAPIRFVVSRDGEELDSVEPYLGADGHLVALREHDQAFLHTHPEGAAGGSGPISFRVEYPSAGRYRLFLQFRHRGEVRTAAFTQVVQAGGHPETAEQDDHGSH